MKNHPVPTTQNFKNMNFLKSLSFKNLLVPAILFLLLSLFGTSLFKHISYPLLWQDEAETAVFAERILKFGYPKIHDGKNAPYGFLNKELATKESSDAYIPSGWGQYYFAVPGVYLSQKTDDFYLKTGLIRIPFAAAGMTGVFLFAFLLYPLFSRHKFFLFLTAYLFLELLSVPLTLHLREARHYSLSLFLIACTLGTYFRYRFYKTLSYSKYLVTLPLFFLLLFNTFYPAFLILFLFLSAYESLHLLSTRTTESCAPLSKAGPAEKWKPVLPFVLIFSLSIPLFWYFEIFSIGAGFSKFHPLNPQIYFRHLGDILQFFISQDLLGWLLFLKIFSLILQIQNRKNPKSKTLPHKISGFLSVFFLFSTALLAAMPVVFERYFIWLQPVLSLLFLLEIRLMYKEIQKSSSGPFIRYLPLLLGTLLISASAGQRCKTLTSHLQELKTPYKGPLDYLIPYIQNNHKNPDQLIIATNFEEHAYIFYLKSKVIIGFFGHDLETDRQINPDILIFRRGWTSYYNPEVPLYFRDFLSRQKNCDQILFPILDYFCNNSPESRHHLFKTPLPQNENQALCLYENFQSKNP